MNGKKTYIAVILGTIAAVCLYAQGVVTNGFDLQGLFQFLNGEAMLLALGFIRSAIAKK